MKILFICSKNKWRSPTAERIYQNRQGVETRSAGVSSSARRLVSRKDLEWADLICVMENAHKRRVLEKYRDCVVSEDIHCLDIPDDYLFMDPELVEMLKASIDPIIAEYI